MKRFIIAALALVASLPAAINIQAQDDDDIYFSKKANKKAAKEAIYAATEADDWSTDANSDWDLDNYNRRGKGTTDTETSMLEALTPEGEEAAFYYEIPDGNGGTKKVPGNKSVLKGADANKYKIVNDTVVLVEQYYYSDLIRRFYNPFFSYYRYSPWYDVAYYDPFYWDFCFYDPWWYVTPSFGFHWGNWYGGWSFGYYSGWYGGWYAPYYNPCPHWHHVAYYDNYHHGHGEYYGNPGSRRGSSRNNFGGHFAHRGGWRQDGGVNRMASAGTNRSYRAANGAHTNRTNGNSSLAAGPTLRGRNTTNGHVANSTMRSVNNHYNRTGSEVSRGNGNFGTGSSTTTAHRTSRYDRGYNNSDSRRQSAGVYQRDNGSTRRYDSGSSQSGAGRHSASRYSGGNYSGGNYSGGNYSGNSSHSSSTYTRSSSSSSYSGSTYSGGGSSHSSGGGYSGGGGGSSHSHSGGGHAGRR